MLRCSLGHDLHEAFQREREIIIMIYSGFRRENGADDFCVIGLLWKSSGALVLLALTVGR